MNIQNEVEKQKFKEEKLKINKNKMEEKNFISIELEKEMEKGEIKILFEEEEKKLPQNSQFFFISFIYKIYTIELINNFFFGLIIFLLYKKIIKNSSLILLQYSFSYFLQIIYNTYFYKKYSNFLETKIMLKYSLIFNVFFFIIYFLFFLFFNKLIKIEILQIVIFSFIILFFYIYFQKSDFLNIIYNLPFFKILESLQIFVITLKLNFLKNNYWKSILIYYNTLSIIFISLAYFFIILGFIFFLIFFFKNNLFRNYNKDFLILFSLCYIFGLWNAFNYYFLFNNFLGILINNKNIFIKNIFDNQKENFLKSSLSFSLCSFFKLLFIIITYKILKKSLIQIFNKKNTTTKIFLQKFQKNIQLNISQVSSVFFKFSNEDKKELENNENCIICLENKSEILIKPCGHSGICKICITEFLKLNENCHICRKKIEKVYIMEFDQENGKYMAEGFIQIEKK